LTGLLEAETHDEWWKVQQAASNWVGTFKDQCGDQLMSSLTTWVMGQSALSVSLHRIPNWRERSVRWRAELLFREMSAG